MFALSLDHETWIHGYFSSICVFSDHMLRGYMTTQLLGYVATWLRGYMATWLHDYVATWLHGYLATWLHGCVATWLRAISMTTLTTRRERVARQSLLALRVRALAKFGEVDTVPVSENSLKYNTFCYKV